MSLDRIDALVGNLGNNFDANGNIQGIFPEVGFTCNGSIQSWVFGARYEVHNQLIELQIWRPTGNGVYTKVGYTTIVANEVANLYEARLSSPLAFQAGDVLGYYQPELSQTQLRLRFEEEGRDGQLAYFYTGVTSPASELDVRSRTSNSQYQIMVTVVTGESSFVPYIILTCVTAIQILQIVGVAL